MQQCRFDHTDDERMSHKCNPTCRLTLVDALKWMNRNQKTFTMQCVAQFGSSRGRVLTRTLTFEHNHTPRSMLMNAEAGL